MELSITSWMNGPFTIVKIEGEIGNPTAHNLKQRLTDLIDYKRRRFIIDLGNASFADFTGIAALVVIALRVRELKGTLRIVAVEGQSKTFLESAGFSTFYPTYRSIEDAIREPINIHR